ncbi:hypothetical protein VTH06DRAFT_2753 [Thermothelomyces fergusii]
MGEMSTPNGLDERDADEFTIKDAVIENMRPFRVIVVGAGFSGILAAIRIPERLRNVELVVYEKNERVGGVWWLNKYPGAACDVPSHSYQYTNVRVTNLATGEVIEDSANVLITARGMLNDMSWPDIPGLSRFQGKLMHSADWDTSYDCPNKRIGIIGNGSSAIQIIPKLQKVEVTPEQRQRLATDAAALFKHRKAFETSNNPVHDSTIRGTAMQRAWQAAPGFAVLGRGGVSLAERWARRAETYLSAAVDGFRNLLMVLGPNSAVGVGSLSRMLEAEVDYAVAVVRKLQREDYAAAERRPERVRDFMQYVDVYFRDTVYVGGCRTWYRRGDKVVGLWPGSTLHAVETLRAARWEDGLYEPVDDAGRRNGLRWLGNGRSITQVDGDPSWYINPDEVQVPPEGRPEENARFKARPWCY